MAVEVTSRETIKPSMPTPHHLKICNLCIFDQMVGMYYSSIIFFYRKGNGNASRSNLSLSSAAMKKSLSETLTRFYPLAGRFNKNNRQIDCNDAGVLYVEARVNCSLSEFTEKLDVVGLLNELVPLHGRPTEPEEEAVLIGIQTSVFSCGGIAIALAGSHKIADGTTVSAFFSSWASITAGCPQQVVQLNCTAASVLFPSSEVLPSNASFWLRSPYVKPGKSSMRRFEFDSEALSYLKASARTAAIPNPSQVEALTGFIWKHVMRASRAITGRGSPSTLTHSVNLRGRMEPPLPDYSIGNILGIALAVYDLPVLEAELPYLVKLVKRSIADINRGYVNEIQGDGGYMRISKMLDEVGGMYAKSKEDCYTFVSWCNAGHMDVDFGWGRPALISPGDMVSMGFKNVIILVDSEAGGIEAWIALEEQEMGELEQDPEFLAFARSLKQVTKSRL